VLPAKALRGGPTFNSLLRVARSAAPKWVCSHLGLMFGQQKPIQAQRRHPAEPPTAQQQTSQCRLWSPPGARGGQQEGSVGTMDAMRKAGEALESATGLPHHPHGRGAPAHGAGGGAAGATAVSGPPEWATSDHYPGEGAHPAARYYPDDAAEPTKVRITLGR
jgi:hypothetical protein